MRAVGSSDGRAPTAKAKRASTRGGRADWSSAMTHPPRDTRVERSEPTHRAKRADSLREARGIIARCERMVERSEQAVIEQSELIARRHHRLAGRNAQSPAAVSFTGHTGT